MSNVLYNVKSAGSMEDVQRRGMDSLLITRSAITRLIHHQRRRTSTIEEVDRYARLSAAIIRIQLAVEVLHQINGRGVESGVGVENSRHGCVAGVAVITDHGRVDEQSQEGVLRGGIAGAEEKLTVMVADAGAVLALSKHGRSA